MHYAITADNNLLADGHTEDGFSGRQELNPGPDDHSANHLTTTTATTSYHVHHGHFLLLLSYSVDNKTEHLRRS